jgi:hypothetical protein
MKPSWTQQKREISEALRFLADLAPPADPRKPPELVDLQVGSLQLRVAWTRPVCEMLAAKALKLPSITSKTARTRFDSITRDVIPPAYIRMKPKD